MTEKARGFYIRKHFRDFAEMAELAQKAIEQGVEEVHLGYTRCAVCGAELEDEVQEMAIGNIGRTDQQIIVHLCSSCTKEAKKQGLFESVGKG